MESPRAVAVKIQVYALFVEPPLACAAYYHCRIPHGDLTLYATLLLGTSNFSLTARIHRVRQGLSCTITMSALPLDRRDFFRDSLALAGSIDSCVRSPVIGARIVRCVRETVP